MSKLSKLHGWFALKPAHTLAEHSELNTAATDAFFRKEDMRELNTIDVANGKPRRYDPADFARAEAEIVRLMAIQAEWGGRYK